MSKIGLVKKKSCHINIWINYHFEEDSLEANCSAYLKNYFDQIIKNDLQCSQRVKNDVKIQLFVSSLIKYINHLLRKI